MCLNLRQRFISCVLILLVLTLTACDKISIPRLGFEEKPEPRLLVTVTYAFSPELVNHSQTVNACDLGYTIPVGDIITNTFLRVGQDRFNGVRAEPPVGQAQGATLDGYRVTVGLQQFQFEPISQSGAEERYHAMIGLDLLAVYEDSQGTALAQTPLAYHKTISLWTPALTSQSTSCSTTQIDGAVEEAAETLAKEMASVMPRLRQSTQVNTNSGELQKIPGDTGPSSNMAGIRQAPQATVPSVSSPAVEFRTKLIDANRNLILESGEAVVLLIETTNVSHRDIASAYVELRGTPLLIEAFKRVAPLPVPLGVFKAGEKRTAEIRGRLGQIRTKSSGELVIGIILSEGLPPGTHTIRAELQPRTPR